MPTEPTHLSGEELEIQARADAATRGPWTPQRRIFADKVWDAIIRDSKGNPVAVCYLAGWDKKSGAAHTDFIAHARTDVPRLLETLVAVRRELAARQWIPVTERLPKESDAQTYKVKTLAGVNPVPVVLWLDKTGPRTSHWSNGRLFATHWQPLPAPPSEHSEGKQEP